MLNKVWWEQWPGRLEHELEALNKAGIATTRHEQWFRKGKLLLRLGYYFNGELFTLDACYPEFYPYFCPLVFGPQLRLDRHQNPFDHNLCLIGRKTDNWNTNNTLAELIVEQFPKLLMAARTTNIPTRMNLEERQGEPISDYYTYQKNSILLIDSHWPIPAEINQGTLDLLLEPNVANTLRGAVIGVLKPCGKNVVQDSPFAIERGKRIKGRWVRINSAPRENTPEAFLHAAKAVAPKISQPDWTQKIGESLLDITGILFPEELQQNQQGTGWVFVVRHKAGKHAKPRCALVRAGRAGKADLQARIPELPDLSKKRVAVAGLGGIGAPCALELARAGIKELRILDFDAVEPGTIVRWPMGLTSAGETKTSTLQNYIRHNYPYTCIVPIDYKIGEPNTDLGPQKIKEFIDGVDVILDMTTEIGVHHFLSDLAATKKIPYILAYATNGGFGGLVARFDPARRMGCWMCLEHAIQNGAIPEPHAHSGTGIQPYGCADITFTAAGFDISEVSLEAVRLCISTLTGGAKPGYPLTNWDVAVLSLRDESGNHIPPRWTCYNLPKSSKCHCSVNKESGSIAPVLSA